VVDGYGDDQTENLDRKVAEVFDNYVGQKSITEWTKKTILDQKRVGRWFLNFVGADRSIAAIKKADIREFGDLLQSLPSNFEKLPQFKGLSSREVAKRVTTEKLLCAHGAEVHRNA
jgi:hypothetical protein